MSKNTLPTIEPVDEGWVARLRDVSSGVAAPTAADPHAMSWVAIRRTRTRRAVLTTGGGVLTVAAVAGAAFALGGPTASSTLLPGGSTSVSASASADPSADQVVEATKEAIRSRAEKLEDTASAALEAASATPSSWHEHQLEGLTYGLPPEIVTSGPVQDEPGVTSAMWHSSKDPDAPPFLNIAYYDKGSKSPAWPNVANRSDGEELSLPGVKSAVALDTAAEVAGLPTGTDVPDDQKGPMMLVLHPTTGQGAYLISLNLPHENAQAFVHTFESTLRLH